ncbi:MAG: UvrD-helicase domain-containing protein [Bacteroidota bacterium]|jgi:superfamily I DNA/RNA helicase
MKILLAGPGTGKTSRIKELIKESFSNAQSILILSFTNATVNELKAKFSDHSNVSCFTLHSFALVLNHLPTLHILIKEEESALRKVCMKLDLDFEVACDMLRCITFDSMILQCVSFMRTNPAYTQDKLGNLDLLIVDEFQDFNPQEQQLVLLLAKVSNQSIILGDDDQSIYGFKDADPDGIISLYNEPSIERLSNENICHRCPDLVVDLATKLIKFNKHRIQKEWKISNKPGSVIIKQFLTQAESDNYIFDCLRQIHIREPNASILLLSPVGFAVNSLRTMLTENQISFVDFWLPPIDEQTLIHIWSLNSIYGSNKLLFLLLRSNYNEIT